MSQKTVFQLLADAYAFIPYSGNQDQAGNEELRRAIRNATREPAEAWREWLELQAAECEAADPRRAAAIRRNLIGPSRHLL